MKLAVHTQREGSLSHRSGHTLLELVIALAILSIGMLGIGLLQITAIRGNSFAGVSSIAIRYAQDQVETFRSGSFERIDSSPGITKGGRPDYTAIPDTPGISSVLTGNGIRIYRVWAVFRTTRTLKTISVWSCWEDERGKWHSVHLATQQGDLS